MPMRSRSLSLFAQVLVLAGFASASPAQTIVYVDADSTAATPDGTSWATAYVHLQDALSAAGSLPTPIEVWIAEGTYMPDGGYVNDQGVTPGSGDRLARFVFGQSVGAMRGGFVGNESSLDHRDPANAFNAVLSGDLQANDVGLVGNRLDNSTGLIHLDGGELLESLRVTALEGIDVAAISGPTRAVTLDGCLVDSNRVTSGLASALDAEASGSRMKNSIFRDNVILSPPAVSSTNAPSGVLRLTWDGNNDIPASLPTTVVDGCRFQSNTGGIAVTFRDTEFAHMVTKVRRFAIANSRFADTMLLPSVWVSSTENDFSLDINVYGCVFTSSGASGTDLEALLIIRGDAGGIGDPFCALRLLSCSVAGPVIAPDGQVVQVRNLGAGNGNPQTTAWSAIIDASQGPTSASANGFQSINSIGRSITGGSQALFLDPAGADGVLGTLDDSLIPSIQSGAIDAGEETGTLAFWSFEAGSDVDDADNDGDVGEPIPIDVAGFPRRVDIETVTDTGPGPAPVADLGAFEVPACQDCPGDRLWQSAVGGDFETPANWFPGIAGIGNTAVFELGATYSVQFPSDIETFALRVLDGDVTFDMGAFTYTLGSLVESPLIVGQDPGDDASLTLRDGRMVAEFAEIGRFAGSSGDLVITGPTSDFEVRDDLVVGLQGAGSFTVSGGASAFALAIDLGALPGATGDMTITGSGTVVDVPFIVSVSSGTLAVDDGARLDVGIGLFGGVILFDGGTLTGNGTVNGTVVNFGDIFPSGDSTQSRGLGNGMTITGDYLQLGTLEQTGAATGSLRVRAGGDPASPASDVLTVLGSADLAGGLVVEFDNAFDPGDQPLGSISALNAGAVTGRFDVAFLPGLTPDVQGVGRFLKVEYPVARSAGERGVVSVSLVVDTLTGDIAIDAAQNFDVNGTPVAAAIDDLNGDGNPDLAVAIPNGTNPGDVVVLLNNGTVGNTWQGF
ncbi:MAG: hypothetical protein AAGD00_04370, partial [Planctomycetota bacterium]